MNFAPGATPIWFSSAVVANRGSNRVRAVTVIVAGLGRVRSAEPAVAMNAVVPAVIVIRGRPVPSPIMILERRMIPSHAGVGPADDDALAGEALRPDVGRVNVIHAGFDGVGRFRGVAGRPAGEEPARCP